MANSYVDYGVVGDLEGAQLTGTFAGVALDYLASTDLKVTITNGTTNVSTEVPAGDAIAVTGSPGNSTIVLDFGEIEGYDSLAAADMVRISRSSSIDNLQRTFTDGSVLKASDLNTQHKQLLFGMQEQVDGGIGSLPLDADNKYDAGSRTIKNLATPEGDTEAATKRYVDNTALYGAAFGHSEPQSWSFTTASGDIEVPNRELILSVQVGTADPSPGPIPAATADDFFIVEINGVMQAPATYTVSSETVDTTTTYTLTLLGAGSGDGYIDNEALVSVRNFGIARNVFLTDITPNNDTSVGISITGYSVDQSADLQQWKEYNGDVMASVGEDGSITTTGDITAGVDDFTDDEYDEDTNPGHGMTSTKIELGKTGFGGSGDTPPIRIYGQQANTDGRIGVSSTGLYFIEESTTKSIRFGVGTGTGYINGIESDQCILEINAQHSAHENLDGVSVKKLDVVDSVLKMGGLSTLQILSITPFAQRDGTDGVWTPTSGLSTGSSAVFLTGLRGTTEIAPRTGTKYIIAGSMQVYLATGHGGAYLTLLKNASGETGEAPTTGTRVDPWVISYDYDSYGYAELPFFHIYHATGDDVDEGSVLTFDVGQRSYETSGDVSVYHSPAYSKLYLIELSSS